MASNLIAMASNLLAMASVTYFLIFGCLESLVWVPEVHALYFAGGPQGGKRCEDSFGRLQLPRDIEDILQDQIRSDLVAFLCIP